MKLTAFRGSFWLLVTLLVGLTVLAFFAIQQRTVAAPRPLTDFFVGPPNLWVWVPSPHVLRSVSAPNDPFTAHEAAHHGAAHQDTLPAYLLASLRTIVLQNKRDFTIRFVTDASFAQLIPHWKDQIDVRTNELEQRRWRVLAMLLLVYHHGGMVLPASTVTLTSLRPFYDKSTDHARRAFFVETPHRFGIDVDLDQPVSSLARSQAFLPDLRIFGAPAQHPVIHALLEQYVGAVDARAWNDATTRVFLGPGHAAFAAPDPSSMLRWQTTQSSLNYRQLREAIVRADPNDRLIVDGQLFGLRDARGTAIPLTAWMRADHDAIETTRPHMLGFDLDEEQLRAFRVFDPLFRDLPELLEHDQSLLVHLWRVGLVPERALEIHTLDE